MSVFRRLLPCYTPHLLSRVIRTKRTFIATRFRRLLSPHICYRYADSLLGKSNGTFLPSSSSPLRACLFAWEHYLAIGISACFVCQAIHTTKPVLDCVKMIKFRRHKYVQMQITNLEYLAGQHLNLHLNQDKHVLYSSFIIIIFVL